MKRYQFWAQKLIVLPDVFPRAISDIKAIGTQLWHPLGITYRQVSEAGVWAIQLYGCFCIGEMWGRRSVVGYGVGGPNPYHDNVH